jgi:hypothetical protein
MQELEPREPKKKKSFSGFDCVSERGEREKQI